VLPLCGETKQQDLDKLTIKPEFVVDMVSDIDFDSFFKGEI
jgi:hypothetical protein